MVAVAKKAWFALMNWKTRTGSPRSPVRTSPLPLPRYRAPGAVAGSHAADGSAPRARRWSRRPDGGLHRDRPVAPSSRSPGRSVRTRATAPPGCARIAPDQPSVAGIPVHRVGDSSALMAPPSQGERCPPNRVNSRVLYGGAEILVALLLLYLFFFPEAQGFVGMNSWIGSLGPMWGFYLSRTVTLFGGLYALVRGLDNIDALERWNRV